MHKLRGPALGQVHSAARVSATFLSFSADLSTAFQWTMSAARGKLGTMSSYDPMQFGKEDFEWKPTRRSILLTAFPLLFGPARWLSATKDGSMTQIAEEFGSLNPNAPAALSRFAFLIGKWRCEAKLKSVDGSWQTFEAAWLGRFILDGYAIADEYRMMSSSGELIVLGMNFRTYDAARKVWNIKWLNALTGNWMDLVSDELGGIRIDGKSITYAFKETVGPYAYTRATYTNHSATHFAWRGDGSDDQKRWSEFMTIGAYRVK